MQLEAFPAGRVFPREAWNHRRNVSRETFAHHRRPPHHLTPADIEKIRHADTQWGRKMYALALTARHVPNLPAPAAPAGFMSHIAHTIQPEAPAGGWVAHIAQNLQREHPQVPAHVWEPAIAHVLQHPSAPEWGIPAGLLMPQTPGEVPAGFFATQTLQGLDALGSFWSHPFKTIQHFVSHPVSTVVHAVKKAAHNFTAKKIVATTKVVAPIAAGAAALYFGAPYLASALSSAGGAISGAAGSVGSFITSHLPELQGVGSTAYKWWASKGQQAQNYIAQLANTPAVQTAAARGGTSVSGLLAFLQQHAPNIPPSVAAQGQGAVANYLATQGLAQQGVQMQSPAAQGLLSDRVSAEQATMGAAQDGTLPSNAAQPNAAPVTPKTDWSKIAMVGIGAAGLLMSATKGS